MQLKWVQKFINNLIGLLSLSLYIYDPSWYFLMPWDSLFSSTEFSKYSPVLFQIKQQEDREWQRKQSIKRSYPSRFEAPVGPAAATVATTIPLSFSWNLTWRASPHVLSLNLMLTSMSSATWIQAKVY